MNTDHVKGAADKAKGAVEDTADEIIGDRKVRAEGKLDKAKGTAHKAIGDAKDTAKSAKIAQGDEGPIANGK